MCSHLLCVSVTIDTTAEGETLGREVPPEGRSTLMVGRVFPPKLTKSFLKAKGGTNMYPQRFYPPKIASKVDVF